MKVNPEHQWLTVKELRELLNGYADNVVVLIAAPDICPIDRVEPMGNGSISIVIVGREPMVTE